LERSAGEDFLQYFQRWKAASARLSSFYNSKKLMKRKFDHGLALDREEGLALKAVLSMAGKKPHEKADGSVVFCVGDCLMGTAGKGGNYASFQKFLVQKVRELGYLVVYRDEYLTSQKFPGLGYQTTFSGDNKIRIKFCKELGIHIHRE
jgi:hypothetical protein